MIKYHEDENENLVDEEGNIIVPREKRQRAEVYSRVVGYLRPVSQWNKGKKAEYEDRKVIKHDKALGKKEK